MRLRLDGPLAVTACPSPNTYTLALPRKIRCSPTINVDRLKPFLARAGTPPAPGPVSNAGQEGGPEVELLLNCRAVRGRRRYLVLRRGLTSADDEWLRLEELAHCPEKVVGFNAAAPRCRAACACSSRSPVRAVTTCAPAGFRLAAPSEVVSCSAFLDRPVLFYWPIDGWVRETVVRRSRAAGHSHVVRNDRLVAAVGAGRWCG